jgi:hypothetical protein
MLSHLIEESVEEIEHHLSVGRTLAQLESQASPSTLRDILDWLPPDLSILFYAPETDVP